MWAWEIIPTRRGVVAEPRVTEREIPVPVGVKAALRERARQAGGQEVTQQRRLRVDHDLDTRSTRAELVRTAKAVSRLMEADKAAPPKRTAKRGSRRQDEKLKNGPFAMPDIQVDLKPSPNMRGGVVAMKRQRVLPRHRPHPCVMCRRRPVLSACATSWGAEADD